MAELQDSASVKDRTNVDNILNALVVVLLLGFLFFLFSCCSGFGVKVVVERKQATIRQMPQAALVVA